MGDCMLSGTMLTEDDDGNYDKADLKLLSLNKMEMQLLVTLLNQDASSCPVDQYVIDTFAAYLQQKLLIKIIVPVILDTYNESLYGLVIESNIDLIPNQSLNNSAHSANPLSSALFKVFRFTKEFVIIVAGGEEGSFSFDLIQFANIICDGFWTRITIEDSDDAWISGMESDEKTNLCALYRE